MAKNRGKAMTEENILQEEKPAGAFDRAKLGIWTFLATELLLFGGLFTAYVEFRIKYPDLFMAEHLKLSRGLGLINTFVLISSSLTTSLGINAIKSGRQQLLRFYLAFTTLLYTTFLVIKYIEWSEDFSRGIYPGTNIFFSLYFMMTGLHGLHVLAGISVLVVIFIMAKRNRFSESYSTPVEISGLYLHFVDIIWAYLFPLLYLMG
jgi:cytochrome c oxidase subunit 3